MKRITAFALCLLFLFAQAQAAVNIRLDEGALLLHEDGGEIVPMGAYGDIVSLGNGLFAAQQGGLYLLMNAQGEAKTDALYSDMRLQGDILLACRQGLWGMLNADGEEIGAFEYTQIVCDEQGNAWALRGDPDDMESDEICLLDDSGAENESSLMVRRLSDAASEGLAAVMLPDSGLWGYCDSEGKMAVPARFSHAGAFVSGRAVVVLDGMYGAIDASGEMIVPAEYDFLEISAAGFMLAARMGTGVDLLDMNGGRIISHDGEETFAAAVGNGYVCYDGRQMLLCDARGNTLETISRQGNVFAGLNGQWIISEGAWGENCVRLSGTQVLHQNIYPLGTADGRAIYACMQVNAARFSNDLLDEIQLAVDMETARYGVIDEHGAELLHCAYESIEYLVDDRLLLYANGLWQMADASGNIYWSYGTIQSEEPSF